MGPHRQLAVPAYLVGFLLALIPPFDAIMQILPLRAGDPRWRFGAFGLLSNAMMIPLTGLLVVFVATSVFEHRRFQRVLGILAILLAVATLGGLGIFALDALQIRGDVKPTAALAFKVASTTAALKATLGLITLAAFGIASFRGPKPVRAKVSGKGPSGLILAPTAAKPGSSSQSDDASDRIVSSSA